MKQIILTGKETKKQIIDLLIEGKASYECFGVCADYWYKKEDKASLLRRVKIYNANIAGGGNGNISTFRNDEAQSHYLEVELKILNWLQDQGISPENITDHIPQDRGLKMLKEWQEYKKLYHNDFIGHTPEEKETAFNWLKNQFERELELTTV